MTDLHFPQATHAHSERRHALTPEADDAFRTFSKVVFAEGARAPLSPIRLRRWI
jgi:hypothetical protein